MSEILLQVLLSPLNYAYRKWTVTNFIPFKYDISVLHSNPYQCLAPYGGPIDPAIALGGFPDVNDPGRSLYVDAAYQKATAVIITFIVKNHHDPNKLKPALEWESL